MSRLVEKQREFYICSCFGTGTVRQFSSFVQHLILTSITETDRETANEEYIRHVDLPISV